MTDALEHAGDALSLESELPSSLMTVNLGPSHPAMHGTVRLTVKLDGESIVEAIPEIGFLHRGFSKSSENSTWHQVLPYTDRLNYVSPVLNNTGYIMGVEKLAGVKPTERAEYLRVLAGEISRICDHLTCVGAIGLELGAFTVFLYAIEARELLWDRIAELCGARVTVSWTRIGGVATDLPPGWIEKLRDCLPRVIELTNEIDVLLTRNRIFVDRTRNVGVISAEETCAKRIPTRFTIAWTSKCRSARAATPTIATCCASPRFASRTASSSSASRSFRPARSSSTTGDMHCRPRRKSSRRSKA